MPQMSPSEEFAFTARTFDAQYLMQICRGDDVIVTVGTLAKVDNISRFCIWAGEGIGAYGDDTEPMHEVFLVPGKTIEETWLDAVKAAYMAALARVSYTFFCG